MADEKTSADRTGGVDKPDRWDPEQIDKFRDLAIWLIEQEEAPEDDIGIRRLRFFCDMEEVAIAHALSDLGETFAPYAATRLCFDRWRLRPPDWALAKFSDCAGELAAGNRCLLPGARAAQSYAKKVERLRAAWSITKDLADKRRRLPRLTASELYELWAKRSNAAPGTVTGWKVKWLPSVLKALASNAAADSAYQTKAANARRESLRLAEAIRELDAK